MANRRLTLAAAGLSATVLLASSPVAVQGDTTLDVPTDVHGEEAQPREGMSALAKARHTLSQAMEHDAAGNHDVVEEDLARAQAFLKQVEAGTDTKAKEEAQRLRTEIAELVARDAHKTPEAKPKLTGFWHRAMGLVEREAETLYHAWRDQQFENHIYRQLIDAKMHLYYAEHALFSSGDADGARQELNKCAAYLQAAASEVSGDRKSRIETMEDEVKALAPLVANPDERAHGQYDRVRADLRRMLLEI